MPKWCKTIIALLLLPVCAGAVLALWHAIEGSGDADAFWVAFLSGAACCADLQAADALLQSSTYLELDTPDDLIWLRDELEPYAQRAKDRYMQQMAQLAPPCLRVTKDLMADVFYFDWKTYEALQHGDAQRVAELQQQPLAATEAVLSEYDRLVEKYHWEK